jgi:UDP-glucose 4-epimerase/UDP-glucuronate decarboxylase
LDEIEFNFDKVYHLAAVVGVGEVMKNPVNTLKVNTLSTFNLLEKVVHSNKKPKILFTSSCENYAGTVNFFNYNIPTDENVPLCITDITNPRWTYASSKILGEICFYHYGKEFGFPTTIIRYHNVYGPRMGNQHVIPEIFQKLKKNPDQLEIYGGNQFRTFCFVQDAADMTINVMDSDKSNFKIVNIGSRNNEVKIIDLINEIIKILQVNPEIIDHGAPSGSVERRKPDINFIESIGCFSERVNFKDGLQQTIEWYRNHI